MTDFGIVPTGFNLKRLEDILRSIQDRHRSTFGELIDTAIATELGQLDGNFASELAECWELLEAAYYGYDPENATLHALDILASLTGTIRRAATASTVGLTLNLNAGTTVNAGSLVSMAGRPDIVFRLDANVTNSGGAPANIAGTATCTQTGAIVAVAGTLTVIGTPATGWNTVTNALDAVPGRAVDSDITLRQRRADELALRGGSTVAAIKADLLDSANHPELGGIVSAELLENTGDAVDVNGLPPHSFEVLIDDGAVPSVANTDIAQAIFESKPAGIQTFGSITANATDALGNAQPVRFSRVTRRPIYISIQLQRTPKYFGDAAVKTALVTAGNALQAGDSVIAIKFEAVPLDYGVTDILSYAQGFSPAPVSGANLAIGVRERATFDSFNIVLT